MSAAMNKIFFLCRPIHVIAALFVWGVTLTIAPANAIEIQNVVSEKGIQAWLVEDHTVPIVAIQFSIGGGSSQDPQDKEGLANLMTGLFDEGAGDILSEDFQARLDDLGAEMAFSASRDRMQGSMRVLADNKTPAFDLLGLAIRQPRFDQEPIDRVRQQLITELKAAEKDPKTIAQNRLLSMIYGKHPYGRRAEGTPETLMHITHDDLVAAHKAMFARDNLHIGIVGPVSAQEASAIIDKIFADLPEKASLKKIDEVKLNDPDFFAAYLTNYVLGGPGLTSRLFSEVREKRGLAYTVGSTLISYDHAANLVVSTGTRSKEAQKTLSTIRDEIRKMAENGITQQELDDAKSYVIGSYAVKNMGSSSDIAGTLVGLQDQGLPIDYISKRKAEIEAVTTDQVKAIAQKLLSKEPTLLIIGPSK